jgi:hypothetical protein
MPPLKTLILDAAVVVTVNLPFGYWRGGARKFSPRWLVAVHAPVPLVVALRVLSGLRWSVATMAVMIGASVLGQLSGGRLRRRTEQRRGE